ncbi:GNAT family N-acetyltransferase [Lacrimispora sp. AGF001]|uniref:GNAT family N-acetyltransferase n=1 Tax=Lacrimispora sp. AGF001 TaxID=3401631 RepID=UPI003B427965
MLHYESLIHVGREEIYQSFLNAFSDYQVPMNMTFPQFEKMLKRRGFDPNVSVGAFEGDTLVGFILNGCRTWNGKATAYDVGTGVVPDFRKQGITSRMLQTARQNFGKSGVEQYVLEVLTANTSAANIYTKNGFTVEREFLCCQMDGEKNRTDLLHQTERVMDPDWELFRTFWDYQPSWQNSIQSIAAVRECFNVSAVRINNCIVGYGIIDKTTGEIPQIAVDKNWRNKGIGSSILADLMNQTISNQIKILNIDTRSEAMLQFITAAGFHNTVNQYEMILELQ